MRKTRITALAAIAAASLALTACNGPAALRGDTDGPLTLKVQEIYSPGDQFADATAAWGDVLEAESDGAVELEYFWGNSVAPSNEAAAAMRDTLIDVARQQPPAAPADFPVINWMSKAASMNVPAMPAGLLQKVGAHLEFVMDSEAGTPVLQAEMDSLGIRYLGAFAIVQQYDMLCKEPLETIEDFRGVKVRVAGQAWVEEAENLGMEPVTLLPEEIYEGYQRGVVDCVMTYPTHWIQSGLWELGGYYVPVKLTGWNQDGLTISNVAWGKLDRAQQKAAYAGVRAWLESFISSQLDGYWQFMTEKEQHGVGTADVAPDVQALVDEHHAEVIDGMAESAPRQVEDPDAFLDEYAALSDKWERIVADLGFDVTGQGAVDFVESLPDPAVPPSEQIDLDPWLDAVMEAAYGNDA